MCCETVENARLELEKYGSDEELIKQLCPMYPWVGFRPSAGRGHKARSLRDNSEICFVLLL